MLSGVSIILYNNHDLLLQLRDDKPNITFPNYWGLIGGSIENNETPFQSIKREIMEEIGLKNLEPKFLRKFEFNNKIEYLYESPVKNVNLSHLYEGQKIQFFGFKEISKLKIRPDDNESIEYFIKKQKFV